MLADWEKTGIIFTYCVYTFLLLTISKTMKKMLGRDRPVGPKEGAANFRPIDMRGRENNNSFPSGDTIQAANWMMFHALYFPALFDWLGGPIFGVLYVTATACARVYYQCHWFGDTMLGALVSTLFHLVMYEVGFYNLLMSIFI